MGRRFSRIRQAAYLNQAVDNYVQWLQSAATRPRNIGGGTARPPQTALGIEPFTVEVAAGVKYLAFASEPSRAIMGSGIGTTAVETTPAAPGERRAGWKSARITMFAGSGSSAAATSEITGLRYLKYAGQSYSHPFGKAAATDTEFDQFMRIRAALSGTPNRRFSLRSEAMRQI